MTEKLETKTVDCRDLHPRCEFCDRRESAKDTEIAELRGVKTMGDGVVRALRDTNLELEQERDEARREVVELRATMNPDPWAPCETIWGRRASSPDPRITEAEALIRDLMRCLRKECGSPYATTLTQRAEMSEETLDRIEEPPLSEEPAKAYLRKAITFAGLENKPHYWNGREPDEHGCLDCYCGEHTHSWSDLAYHVATGKTFVEREYPNIAKMLKDYCHPFQSAREPKAGEVAANETVNGPTSQEPSSPTDKLRVALQSSGGNGGSTKGADGSAQRPTAWIGTAQASHEERPLVRGSSKEGATANSPSQGGPPPSHKPEDASPADKLRADPPAPLRNREATCRACKDFHETGDCPDEFEQMLDLHHALLRAERERAEKAEAENENLLANLALLDNAGRQRDAERERAEKAEETLARIEEEARLSAGTFTGDLLRALLDGKSVRSKAWMERRGRE